MRFPFRIIPLAVLATAGIAGVAQAQSAQLKSAEVAKVGENRFKWFFGVQGGALFFGTQRQTQSGIPAAGAHVSVVSRRGGLQLGFEEGFGSEEPSAFVDATSGTGIRQVEFDRIRRYGFNLTGYPVRGSIEPYLGVGFGMIQVVDWRFDPNESFTSPTEAGLSTALGNQASASAFASFLAGLQFRVGRLAAFSQYQISTAPRAGDLLRGTGHSLLGGLRFSLGSAREDVKGGGY